MRAQELTKFTGLLLLGSVLELPPIAPVYADCSNPPGIERDQIYNNEAHTYQFCDGTKWHSMKGDRGDGSSALTLISTQTASNSADLQFTNLPTIYNTLFLNCAGLLMSSNTVVPKLRIGEGTGPTWKTAAKYTQQSFLLYGNGSTGTCSNHAIDNLLNCNGNIQASATNPYSLKIYFDNVGSANIYKYFTGTSSLYMTNGDVGYIVIYYNGYWTDDTNPVTGIQLVGSGGNIASGTCSLYGMN
jgi:hypothetical protein